MLKRQSKSIPLSLEEKLKELGFKFQNFTIEQLDEIYQMIDELTSSLKKSSLQFSLEELEKIICGKNPVTLLNALVQRRDSLGKKGFNTTQCCKVLIRGGGELALAEIDNNFKDFQALGLTHDEMIKIGYHHGGKRTLLKLRQYYCSLKLLNFNKEQIITVANSDGGGLNLRALKENSCRLAEKGYSFKTQVKIASHIGGAAAIAAVLEHHDKLIKYGFTCEDIAAICHYDSGRLRLNLIVDNLSRLSESGKAPKEICKLSHGQKGHKKLQGMINKLPSVASDGLLSTDASASGSASSGREEADVETTSSSEGDPVFVRENTDVEATFSSEGDPVSVREKADVETTSSSEDDPVSVREKADVETTSSSEGDPDSVAEILKGLEAHWDSMELDELLEPFTQSFKALYGEITLDGSDYGVNKGVILPNGASLVAEDAGLEHSNGASLVAEDAGLEYWQCLEEVFSEERPSEQPQAFGSHGFVAPSDAVQASSSLNGGFAHLPKTPVETKNFGGGRVSAFFPSPPKTKENGMKAMMTLAQALAAKERAESAAAVAGHNASPSPPISGQNTGLSQVVCGQKRPYPGALSEGERQRKRQKIGDNFLSKGLNSEAASFEQHSFSLFSGGTLGQALRQRAALEKEPQNEVAQHEPAFMLGRQGSMAT